MNMIAMVGLLVLIFFTSLVVMCYYRNRMNPKIWNIAFIAADIAFYFAWNYASYERGWLKEGWMNLENISPMVCTVMAMTLIMNDRVKQAAYDTLSFFSIGLFLALMISPEHAYLFNFNIEANFIYTAEAACHLVVALFGIYLVISKQVKPGLDSWLRSLAFTFSIIGFGVFLNYVFHKTYFGMNPYGNSAIYMLDIFHSHDATLLAYLAGVLVVLTVGMQCMYTLAKALDKLDAAHNEQSDGASAEGRDDAKRGKKVYLFDFDGVLVDSMPTFGNMVLSVLKEAEVEYPDDVVKVVTPLGYRGMAEYLKSLGVKGEVDELREDMVRRAVYEYENNILAKEGVAEALAELRSRGFSLNVLTASPHAMLDPCLKRTGLYAMFDNAWSCDDFGRTKADPEIYKMAAERLGVSVKDVVFCDDNIGAIGTAHKAGVETCGVYDASSSDLVAEMKSAADGYVYNLKELFIGTDEMHDER